jgi:hypothetical protein
MRKFWIVGLMLIAGCSAGPRAMLGETREDVLAEVDVADITVDRGMTFGEGNVSMYADFAAFAEDKAVTGGSWTPHLRNWTDELSSRTFVKFTNVVERTVEARAGNGEAEGTTWYFWDEDDRLVAILKEDWHD